MSDAIIQVENLGKRYSLPHLGQQRYVALRDVLTDKARRLFRQNGRADSRREEFWALKDVSFEVKQGEVLGIIGRNGAGKSTLLKVLSRITEPTVGRVRIRGRVASLLEVGTGFHPELTGRENIFLNGAILGMTRAEIKAKFDEIVAFAEVDRFLDTPVKRYSSGMYVRLAFAVAAHLDPEILVVDEVLAVGDAAFQGKCLGKMGEVSRSGRTILFVSHNMAAVSDLCSRALVFENGREVFSGSATGAVTEYIHRITRRDGVHRLRCSGCEIADLWFENAAKQRVATASIGQPLTAAIEFVVSEPNASQTMVLQFSTSDGSVVWTAETTPGVLQKIQSSGRFSRISVEIPQIMLYAKTYFVGVGIMNYGEGPIVWDRRFTQLTVVSNSALPHQGFDAARVNSVFMPHTWSAPNQ